MGRLTHISFKSNDKENMLDNKITMTSEIGDFKTMLNFPLKQK